MGQYRQWLYYREVDQHLRAQQKQLVEEFAQFQASSALLEASSLTQNVIIQALILQQIVADASLQEKEPVRAQVSMHTAPVEQQDVTNGHISSFGSSSQAIPSSPSSPLFARNGLLRGLPHPSPPNETEMQTLSPTSHTHTPISSPHQRNGDLLPEDMTPFIEEYAPTDPQLTLPWGLREAALATHVTQSNGVVDVQTIHTNHLVQRWLERWGRQGQPQQIEQQQQLRPQLAQPKERSQIADPIPEQREEEA